MFNIRLFAKNFCFKGRGAYSEIKKGTQEFFMCPTAESNKNTQFFTAWLFFHRDGQHTTQRKKEEKEASGLQFQKIYK